MRTILGVGNCQVRGMVHSAAAVLGLAPMWLPPQKAQDNQELIRDLVSNAEAIFARGHEATRFQELAKSSGRPEVPVIIAPRLHFSGFHPDVATPVKAAGRFPHLPMENANSAILLAAWREGLGPEEALTLFRDEVYEALGYYDAFPLAIELLVEECRRAGFEVEPLIRRWIADGPFCYLPLHPKITVLSDIALKQLRIAGLYDGAATSTTVDDTLARHLIWPVYPEIGERLGIAGDYVFQPRTDLLKGFGIAANGQAKVGPMDLETFVERTYEGYRQSAPDFSSFPRMADPRLESIGRFVKRMAPVRESNPYKQLPASNWWSKSVAAPPAEEVDPVTQAKFTIGTGDRIATAGSCFAQHIARRLASAGFNYLVTERAPPDCPDPVAEDYGIFTARFGNIYTVRQLVQLAERAFGGFKPATDAWRLADGGHVDPFRPRIGAKPFDSLDALRSARDVHFAAVREMFETADVFIFTLGLTECWWSSDDHAVVPLPPGILGANVPADEYVPKNFTAMEVIADLQLLLDLFQKLNPSARIVLTVSPVPLVATFENEHVLTATTYSKSVLRVAAGEIAKDNDHVAYFPSYEIVTGSFSRGRYFADDLRQVTTAGVDHVMKSFLRHFTASETHSADRANNSAQFRAEAAAAMDIVCDEEELEKAPLLPMANSGAKLHRAVRIR